MAYDAVSDSPVSDNIIGNRIEAWHVEIVCECYPILRPVIVNEKHIELTYDEIVEETYDKKCHNGEQTLVFPYAEYIL